ncbi:hypothetical protein CALVIDRAFT_120630 [Calocera viscosa TUFC12733]|uniref:Uncharacterized protein n=1 Tax=Calocera viscosa (strain TUFC12733) TaxID=1330018 RepID=A0A167MAJ1_CALVF|nr:hypothetical protein CALVIDRAFT_120630 [Calocera viscosa TUFC12733]
MLIITAFCCVWFGDRPALQVIAIPLLVAGYPIAACRLYIHLKKNRVRDLRTTDFADAKTPSLGIITLQTSRQHQTHDSWSDESDAEGENTLRAD